MATQMIGAGFDLGPAHQQAQAADRGLWSRLDAISAAFHTAVAAEHIYDGLIAHSVPRDEAAKRTFEMLFDSRAVNRR